ncbi:hypothetical protein DEIPH_ctg013orf0030 [Deinococcus phoenicis]|uniref:Phage portal protein n=1 Tax=Deinococcus phoenicis TaxID=1476583 RepID=A0A016QS05_9DEIO|nr:hypothetical protein [Deinococcus phoenicis]EYB68925.1 hypothetical protein DEIPH_ctg013orf0030 [Deinococcus phoenicis]
MDTAQLLQLQRMQARLADVRTRMTRETAMRELYADRFGSDLLGDMAANFSPETLDMALQGENPFREAVQRLVVPVRAGGAQWTGDDTWTDDRKAYLKGLAGLFGKVVTTLALTGKAAVLPWKGPDGQVRVTALRGYLHPVYSSSDPDQLERVLSVTTSDGGPAGIRYTVWAFEAGRVTIHRDLDDPTRYALTPGEEIELPYAAGRLPLAFVAFDEDGEGQPYSPGDVCYSAFRRFLHRLVQENVTYHSGAYKQKVIYGNNGPVPALGPFKLLELDSEAKYEEHGADTALIKQMTDAREAAGRSVWASAGAPEAQHGAGESGEARAIAGQMHEQTCDDLGDKGAALLTDAAALLAGMGVTPKPIEFTCRPLFVAKRAAEQANLGALYRDKGISRGELLLRLQDSGLTISADELKRAAAESGDFARAVALLNAGAPTYIALDLLRQAGMTVITEQDVEAQRALDLADAGGEGEPLNDLTGNPDDLTDPAA